ncbi:DUF2306 domain-containing protein [Nocardioides marmoriginsengisoli]|uniref:DUF2306 domain-containing protein n=1 Tax=Nocardioides marmoriginsengisoli TaxID=661483 RepID=A0A3N0CDH4_9ACTN|nr:DUF2306 domain-containing protein [Nocardioides marmoriginsengisoli]RNL61349.1 DUF2306 domain-containing protein [Nocardioides marmoriginsengisoli]
MHEWNALVATHAVAATLALVIGGANLVRTPRGDRAHRVLGRTWLVVMYFVAGSSFWIQQLRPGNFSWIHGLSTFTLITLTLGWWFARHGNRPAHAGNMIGTYLGLWGAFIGVVAVPSRLVPQAFQDDWWAMSLLVSGIVMVGLGLVLVVTRALQPRLV